MSECSLIIELSNTLIDYAFPSNGHMSECSLIIGLANTFIGCMHSPSNRHMSECSLIIEVIVTMYLTLCIPIQWTYE